MVAFGFNPRGTDETWCIDNRGVLTLSINPQTYQKLGLLGRPLPWKIHRDRYSAWIFRPCLFLKSPDGFVVAIVVVLSQRVPKGAKHWNPLGAKQKSALELYDDLREKAGFESWDVVYHSKTNGMSPLGMFGWGFTLVRSVDRSAALGSGAGTKGYPSQRPHPVREPIAAAKHRQRRTWRLENIF